MIRTCSKANKILKSNTDENKDIDNAKKKLQDYSRNSLKNRRKEREFTEKITKIKEKIKKQKSKKKQRQKEK